MVGRVSCIHPTGLDHDIIYTARMIPEHSALSKPGAVWGDPLTKISTDSFSIKGYNKVIHPRRWLN